MEKEESVLRDTLIELYWEKGMSLNEIANELNTYQMVIFRAMEKHKIRRRTIKKSTKLKWKHRKKLWKRDERGRFEKKYVDDFFLKKNL